MGTLWSSGKRDTDEQPENGADAPAGREVEAVEAKAGAGADEDAGAGPGTDVDEPPEAELLEDDDEALDLAPPQEEERTEPPTLLVRAETLNMRVVGAVGVVILLLLTALAVIILGGPLELQIPPERYGDHVLYDVTGDLELYSLEPVPVSLMGLDLEINQLSLEWSGTVEAGVREEATLFEDGYGAGHTVFQRYLSQELDDVTGHYASEGSPPSQISSASLSSDQQQYVDQATLEIIREEIETYGEIDETATGGLHSLQQKMVSWVPRNGEQGLLPHASLYVGRNLTDGDSGSFVSQGVAFNWEASEGGVIDGHETLKLSITTSKHEEITFIQHLQYQHDYRLDLWLSEQSAFPLRFSLDFNSDLKSPQNTLFSVGLNYDGVLNQLITGDTALPSPSGGSITGSTAGEYKSWVSGAPAFGNAISSLDYSLQDAIQLARDQLPGVDNYLQQHEDAFVTHAAYRPDAWNLTLAHQVNSSKVTGWELEVNETSASGEERQLDNPLLKPADLPQPLTLSSAEALLVARPEIAAWAADGDGLVDHATVNLSLGQNLASRENLESPLGILDLGLLEQAVIASLLEGELDFSALTEQVDASGGYGYFISQEQPQEQYSAAVDAKDGLVLFTLQQTSCSSSSPCISL